VLDRACRQGSEQLVDDGTVFLDGGHPTILPHRPGV
jgi:hypothetical protein